MTQPLALIIDDNYGVAHIFAKVLDKADYQTEIIMDGIAACQRLQETTPALVILDIHLPHISGEELLDQIRSEPRLEQTRVIVVTAHPQAARFWSNRAETVLSKPLKLRQIRHIASRFHPSFTPVTEPSE
ncbi:MAG: response regulator [Chloroflexota bacterium]